jgi:hypothetical protein
MIIHIRNAHRTHHGGTTEVFNHDGGLNNERFERVWQVGTDE